MKKNVLVFPCGSEIGLEIHRSLKYSPHFNLIGASSVSDHGSFVYENYIQEIPFQDEPDFIRKLNEVILKYNIDFIYPSMDSVIAKLGELKDKVHCQVIGSPAITTSICLSKKKTTEFLSGYISMPAIFDKISDIANYPVFLKPDVGYGGRNTKIANAGYEVEYHLKNAVECLIFEYLPGEEYTVDCFTNKDRHLLFSGARLRSRISNGISVNTRPASKDLDMEFKKISESINERLQLRGAWFYQVKKSKNNEWKVIEVAARLGGSSGLFRSKGVNFALLTLWDAIGNDIEIIENDYELVMDRALNNKFKIQIEYKKVYIDFDDTVLLNGKINTEMVAFLYQCRNNNKEIICITRHSEDITHTLELYKLNNIFDKVIHLRNKEIKSLFIEQDSIFIDDSFTERKEVASLNIPVFSPDMVAALIQ